MTNPSRGFDRLEEATRDLKGGIVRPQEGYECGVWYGYPEHIPPKGREVVTRLLNCADYSLSSWDELYEALLWPMDSTLTCIGEGWTREEPLDEWLMFPLAGGKDAV